MYDQAYTALIEDLEKRGLLSNTLVASLSEFGRTPRVNPAGGRDHWPQCWTVYFAGGGVQGGRVVGKSDAQGHIRRAACHTSEIVATIYIVWALTLRPSCRGPQSRLFPIIDRGYRRDRGTFLINIAMFKTTGF